MPPVLARRTYAGSQFDFVQAMEQRFDQLAAAFGVLEEIVLEKGVAVDDPKISQHLVQHAGRAAGAALIGPSS